MGVLNTDLNNRGYYGAGSQTLTQKAVGIGPSVLPCDKMSH